MTVTSARVCGISIATLSLAGAVDAIIDAAVNQRPLRAHLCNAYTLSLAERDERLRAALTAADLNLPDGTPVAWLLRRHGVHAPVRGPSLLTATVSAGQGSQLRHYLWGGGDEIAQAAAHALRTQHDAASVVTETPPFREPTERDLRELAERFTAAGADVLWVGLGTPRQDYVVDTLAQLTRRPVVPVGAAFDFVANAIREAPALLHGSGLEWLYRLRREPRRLWRRYLIGNPRFVMSAARHAIADWKAGDA